MVVWYYLQWERAHEDATCEEFAQWKIDNDPTAQEQGLAAHLHANGIGEPIVYIAVIRMLQLLCIL